MKSRFEDNSKIFIGFSFRTWKVVASYNECLWGIEGSDVVSCKLGADVGSIVPGNSVTLSDENGQFKSFSLQDKPSSFCVMHAGWVVYEKANFKGIKHRHINTESQ